MSIVNLPRVIRQAPSIEGEESIRDAKAEPSLSRWRDHERACVCPNRPSTLSALQIVIASLVARPKPQDV